MPRTITRETRDCTDGFGLALRRERTLEVQTATGLAERAERLWLPRLMGAALDLAVQITDSALNLCWGAEIMRLTSQLDDAAAGLHIAVQPTLFDPTLSHPTLAA